MAAGLAEISTLDALDALTSTHKYVVLNFWVEWSKPCQSTSVLFARMAQGHAIPGALAFVKVNVDEAPELAEKFGVFAVPGFYFLVDGELENEVEVQGRGGGGAELVRVIMGSNLALLPRMVEVVARLAREEKERRMVVGLDEEES